METFIGVLLLTSLVVGCGGHSSSSSSSPSPSPIGSLGELATPQGGAMTVELSPAGGQVQLPGGAVLHVPAGALAATTKVTVTRFALALEQISFYVAGASAYQLEADRDVDRISPPLRLEVPGSDAQVAVGAVGDGQWTKRSEYTGGSSAVVIDHFSRHTIALVEPMPALTPTAALLPPPSAMAKVNAANDFIRDNANEWEKGFLGIGEIETPMLHCEELEDLIRDKQKEWRFEFPEDLVSDPLFSTFHMGRFLFTSKSPSEVTGPERLFALATHDAELRIRTRVLNASRPLSPAQFLQLAVEESGNNAALGVLAAHNFLKQTTNDGRDMIRENFGDPFTGELVVSSMARTRNPDQYSTSAEAHGGAIAAKLRGWRNQDRSPAGTYDKMGPLYHVFAAMTAATFMPHIRGGSIAVAGEAAMRATGITGDVADFEKGQADFCGRRVGNAIVELFADPGAIPRSPDAGALPDAKPTDNTKPNLTCGMNTAWDGDRCFFIRETPRLHCLPASPGSLQYVWQDYKKDLRYWYLTVSYFGNTGKYSAADAISGTSKFECETSSVSETLACLVAQWNAENTDCVDAAKLGQRCLAVYGLADICGQARLSQAHFQKGSENYDEVWAFIKAHEETNSSYDAPP